MGQSGACSLLPWLEETVIMVDSAELNSDLPLPPRAEGSKQEHRAPGFPWSLRRTTLTGPKQDAAQERYGVVFARNRYRE